MSILRRITPALILLSLLAVCAHSQSAPLTKDNVIQMVKAGLSDDIIVSKIHAEPNLPTLSADDLIALKSAGVSDAVIRALLSAPAPPAASGPSANPGPSAPPPDPNDPMAVHDPGIYLLITSHEGSKTMVLIERAGMGRDKSAHMGRSAASFGIAKAQIRAEVPGSHAPVRAGGKPEFYMYFPPTGNLGAADSISGPTQFSLMALDQKKDHREMVVAKMGQGRASSGMDEKKTLTFTADKFRPYAYKVTPDTELKAGEYAFVASMGMGGMMSSASVVIYDFGVDE